MGAEEEFALHEDYGRIESIFQGSETKTDHHYEQTKSLIESLAIFSDDENSD